MKDCNKSGVTSYLNEYDDILNTMACKMLTRCKTDVITQYFIKCMIPHHQAAIYMCENLLKYTNYGPLVDIAQNIICMQEKGIKEMKDIEKTIECCANSKEDMECYMSKYCDIVNIMIYKMRRSPKCLDINLNFTNEMIPHHEGAVKMCRNLLEYDIDPRLKEVADSIIAEQEKGIEDLEKIRKKLCDKIKFFID